MPKIEQIDSRSERRPWNKDRLVGQKYPLKSRDVWAIRTRLELSGNKRNLALFDLAIDSKLRACDLVSLKIGDIQTADRIRERTEATRLALIDWLGKVGVSPWGTYFPAGPTATSTFRRDNTHAWFITGSLCPG